MIDKQILGVDDSYRTHSQSLTAVGAVSAPHLFAKGATIRAFGPATAVTLVVEQHPATGSPPADDSPYWAAALSPSETPLSGNPAAGMAPDVYGDAGASWWRVRVSALTGIAVEVILSGSGF